MSMTEAHQRAYEYLGRMDAELGATRHPGADLHPAFGEGQEAYHAGFRREQMSNRKRPRSLAQMHADMVARSDLEKLARRLERGEKPLTRTPKKLKPDVDDW